MHVIEICLLDRHLAAEMAEMRTWLDDHGYEPSIFHYQQRLDGLVILVGFEMPSKPTHSRSGSAVGWQRVT